MDILNDPMLKMLAGPIMGRVTPILQEAHTQLMSRICGKYPASFKTRMDNLYDYTDAEIQEIWEAACQAAAEV